jgi:hypothetical protein
MEKYHCERCNYSTNNKTKFQRHLGTKKHQESPFSHHLVTKKSPFLGPKVTKKSPKSHQKSPFFDQKSTENEHRCKYCAKTFKYKQGMYRNIKYYCKKSEDEDLKELVRLMNEQLKEKDQLLEEKEKEVEQYESQEKKYLKQQERNNKMIKKLTDKLQINHFSQNNVIVNNHIRLLNYKDTDLSHLTHRDYKAAINKVNYATFDIMKRIHFNPKKPENMNIYIPNIKDKYVVMFQENAWQIQARSEEVDELISDKYLILREWYDENVRDNNDSGYEILKRNFQRFDANIEDKNVRERVKNDIIMFLYNKRNMIVKQNEELMLE